ncbi:MAG: DNA translocase FtsK [Acutalibacteraceae bacterium]
MANKKKSASKSKKSSSKAKKGTSKKKKGSKKLSFYQENRTKIMLVFFLISILSLCISFIPGYKVWSKIRGAFFGFFGFGFVFLNVCFIIISVRIALDNLKRKLWSTTLSAFGLSAVISSITHLCLNSIESGRTEEWIQQLKNAALDGWTISDYGFSITGGVIGGFFGGGLLHSIGKTASFIILILLLIICLIVFLNISFSSVGNFVSSVISGSKNKIDSGASQIKEKHNVNKNHRREIHEIKNERKRAEAQRRREYEIQKEQEKALSDDFDFLNTDVETDFDSEKKRPKRAMHHPVRSNSIFTKYEPDENVISGFEDDKNDFTDEENGYIDTDEASQISTPGTDPNAFSSDFDSCVDIVNDSENLSADLSDNASKIVENAATSAEKLAQKNRSEVESYKDEQVLKREYAFPPIDCLSEPDYSKEGDHALEMKTTASKLVETLRSFGVETTLIGVSRGPSVTRYELQPAPGVKISKITNLADDIALNLASSGVRIEAPIPNKSAVGIEVPNQTRSMVKLREIISSSEFKNAKSKLNVALGKDITGGISCADLAKMPHLLIAGTTGSGKSVCLNCMIVSILYNAKPSEVKLLMIDPKQVEFSVYNGIPHLLVPVISDVRKAAGSLAWAVGEMENRYKTFAACGVRNIGGFNKFAKDNPEYELMPQIVIFIDELNDLMMVSPKEVEDSICRLAQKARAAGMYLVVATQRPSVDVITGIIKANIPSRLSLSVSSQVDSRTILDTIGAEKLLGNGDMLFNPVGVSKPVRIQGGYVSDPEIEKIVDFLKNQEEAEYDSEVMDEIEKNAVMDKKQQASASAGSSAGENGDEMLEKAMETAIECEVISTSLLQRKLRIGYARAARIVDQLDEMGLIGPSEGGSKPRKFLMTRAQFLEMKARKGEAQPSVSETENEDFDIFAD